MQVYGDVIEFQTKGMSFDPMLNIFWYVENLQHTPRKHHINKQDSTPVHPIFAQINLRNRHLNEWMN